MIGNITVNATAIVFWVFLWSWCYTGELRFGVGIAFTFLLLVVEGLKAGD